MAKQPEATDKVSVDAIYSAVATRRTPWDAQLWQIQSLALAVQGILLTGVFASGTQRWPRIVAAALAVLVGSLALQLFLRYRHAEIFDSEWLAKEDAKSGYVGVHGKQWARDQNAMKVAAKGFGWLTRLQSTSAWRWGLLAILLVDVASLIVALRWDWVFTGPNG
jgi:hypothetical protein